MKIRFLSVVLISAFSLLQSCNDEDGSNGPAPVVQGFSPQTGPAETTVRIYGMNFNPDAARNEVFFNGTKAIVTSATENEIITTVPAGASTGKISVKSNGASGSSESDFTVTVNVWAKKSYISVGRQSATAFTIDGKGYVGLGEDGFDDEGMKDFWEFNPTTNTWTQKANFGGEARTEATAFVVNSKAYVGTGFSYVNSVTLKDFWEYNPTTNAWVQKADFGGGVRHKAIGLAIGDRGYVGCGSSNYYGDSSKKDFWEYNSSTNSWIQKADFGGLIREEAVAFVIGTKGYVGLGRDQATYQDRSDFWEFDPTLNTWIQKTAFGGGARYASVAFSVGSAGYVGLGYGQGMKRDFWKFSPTANTWVRVTDFFGGDSGLPFETGTRIQGVAITLGTKAYVGTGEGEFWGLTDWWIYTPE